MSIEDTIKQAFAELDQESDARYRVWLREHNCPEDRIEAAVEARNSIVKTAMEYFVHGEQPVIEWDEEHQSPVMRPRVVGNKGIPDKTDL